MLAVIAALAVVVAVLVVSHLPAHRPPPARAARSEASARGAPPAPVTGSAAGQALPDGLIGRVLPLDGQLRLPVTGRQPSWYWPATGRRELIGGLPPEPSGYLFTRVGGGWAVQPGFAAQPGQSAQPGCGACAGAPAPVYFLSGSASSVTRAGTANRVAPGVTAGSLWLTSYQPDSDPGTAAGTAREVSASGAALRPPVRLPVGYVVARGTGKGLLLAPASPRPGMTAYRLWDPAGTRLGRSFAAVIAASATEIAWAPPCAKSCRLHVLDLAAGRDTTVALPAGSSAANGAFSPDGSLLALQVSTGPGGDGGGLAMQLDVASAATGRLTVVPGTWVSSDALVGFGWPASGDSLVAELSFTTKVQVAAWQPGAARIAVAAIGPGQNSGALIVG
jgi:hypothetical protein